jgi:hypothetical protein
MQNVICGVIIWFQFQFDYVFYIICNMHISTRKLSSKKEKYLFALYIEQFIDISNWKSIHIVKNIVDLLYKFSYNF